MKKLLPFICLVLTGCFSSIDDDFGYIDPELKPFANEFVADASLRGIKVELTGLTIKPSQMEGLGEFRKETNTIVIKRSFIDKELSMKTHADSNYVKLVIYHELGHYLGKSHRNGISIMNTDENGMGDFIGTLHLYNEGHNKEITDELFK